MTKRNIYELLEMRDYLIKTDDKSEVINEIEIKITEAIKSNYYFYSVDFILETLTEFGQTPNIVYDDNGMFAVSDSGYQTCATDDERITGMVSVMVDKKQWFDTIRKALWYYIQSR